jgi:chromosome segregation ATPase
MTTTAPPPTTLAVEPGAIVVSQYEVLLGDIAQARADAAGAVFDYTTKDGNKAARSYVFAQRKLRARIDAARKDAKAWALDYGRTVDSQARDLLAQIDELIEPHQTAIDAIAKAEADRVERHRETINLIMDLGRVTFETSSRQINDALLDVRAIDVDSLEEFREEGAVALAKTIRTLEEAYEKTVANEAAAAELAELRELQRIQKEQAAEAERERQAQARADEAAKAVLQELEQKAAAAEARAAVAEAKAAEAKVEEPLRNAVSAKVGPTVGAPVDLLKAELLQALAGWTRRDIVERMLAGTFHPAVVIDWGRVA